MQRDQMLGQRHADGVEVGVEVESAGTSARVSTRREDADHRDVDADPEAELGEVVVERGGDALVGREHRGRGALRTAKSGAGRRR